MKRIDRLEGLFIGMTNPANPLILSIPVQTHWQQKSKIHMAQTHHPHIPYTHSVSRISLEPRVGTFSKRAREGRNMKELNTCHRKANTAKNYTSSVELLLAS